MATKKQLKDLALDCVELSVDMEVAGFKAQADVLWAWVTTMLGYYKAVMLAEAKAKLAKK